jgi:small ligand-binding sensory domain FIST
MSTGTEETTSIINHPRQYEFATVACSPNHNGSLGIYCIVRPITVARQEYTASFAQSRWLVRNILHRSPNHGGSLGIYCIGRPITVARQEHTASFAQSRWLVRNILHCSSDKVAEKNADTQRRGA